MNPPVVVITGTSRGLGLTLAEYFLEKKYRVIGCSRTTEPVIVNEMYSHTILDLGDEKEVRSWVKSIRLQFGHVDVLICNASLVQSALFLSLTPGNLMESFLRNNIAGVFYVLREISKHMVSHGSGRIITISSTTTAVHQEGTSMYSATKSAVTEMIKILAKEVASRGVTCNVIAPAMMKTESSQDLAANTEWESAMLKKQTIERIISKEEVCHVADFLISPLSSAITGQVIYIGLSN
jgi:3-oxoacyl-[acyl-carrier protein] reductase